MNGADQYFGKAGQFVTSVLQTVGVYSQGDVLHTFAPFFSSFGALIYFVGLSSAAFSVAMFGNYRQAAYLIVGPGLFSWMLFTTVESNGAAFEFGNRVDTSQERQQEVLSTAFPERSMEESVRVSWFFANFDRTVSYVVQKIVSVLINTELKEDLTSLARERIFARVLQGRAIDPQFLSLFTITLQGDCATFIEKGRLLSEKRYLDPSENSEFYKTKKAIEEDRKKHGGDLVAPISSQSLIDYLKGKGFAIPDSRSFTCQQIWDMTITLLEEQSRLALAPTENEREQFDVSWENVIGSVEKKLCTEVKQDQCKGLDQTQLTDIAKRIVMAQIVKNTLATTPHSMFMTQVAGRGRWENGNSHRRIFGDIVSYEQNSYRFLISYLAATIPYLQGLLLYMLSALFPFFTIFLLLPGKYSSFFVWPFLWLWVKSWDVGYAIVFLFREVLWDLFPYVGQARGAENYDALVWDNSNPNYLMNLVYSGDPSANATLYWTVIGCLTLSVPCLTAYLCLGATNLFNVFRMAFEEVPGGMQEDTRNRTEAVVTRDMDRKMIDVGARNWWKGANAASQNPGEVAGIPRESMGDNTRINYTTASANFARAQAWFNGDAQEMLHFRNTILCRPFGLPNPVNYPDLQTFAMNTVQENMFAGLPYDREFSNRPLNSGAAGGGGDSGYHAAGMPAAAATPDAPSF